MRNSVRSPIGLPVVSVLMLPVLSVTRAICYPVFAFSVQLTLTHTNFVVRYIRSLAFLSVAV